MNLYQQTSYKTVLQKSLEAKKKAFGSKYTFEALAKHCRIQKTYLSKILNREGNLNADQLYMATDFLGFSAEEQEFTHLLHEKENSVFPERQRVLAKRLQAFREKHELSETHLQVTPTTPAMNDLAIYYSDPVYQVIHMGLTIRGFAQEPAKLAPYLGITRTRLNECLEDLQRMGVIRWQNAKWEIENNMHLPQSAKVQKAYRSMMRLQALQTMTKLKPSEFYSFSALFTADASTYRKIRDDFMELLKRAQKSAGEAKETQVYQLNFDLLPVLVEPAED